jgi:hypothetical protein
MLKVWAQTSSILLVTAFFAVKMNFFPLYFSPLMKEIYVRKPLFNSVFLHV